MKKRLLSLALAICLSLTLLPTAALAADPPAPPNPLTLNDTYFKDGNIRDGWYTMMCREKYIVLNADGNAELRYETPTTTYYVESKGDKQYTVKNKAGKYLAIAGNAQNSALVTTSATPYLWLIHRPREGFGYDGFEMCSAESPAYKVCASEEKYLDGTALILWENHNVNYGVATESLHLLHYIIRLRPLNADGTEKENYAIKMSSWAYPTLADYGDNPYGYGDDFTKPINRFQMADTLVRLTESFIAVSLKELPGMIPQEKVPEFTDTESRNAWYLAYWGITSGVGNNKFDPAGRVTREQMAVFLVNTMNYYDKHLMDSAPPRSKANLSKYKDANKISKWAKDAMSTMVGTGYLTGSGGMLNPGGYCTIEQTLVLYDRLQVAYEKTQNVGGEMYQPGISKGWHDDGKFTIASYLGGYLTLNGEGKCVVNKTQSQVFTRKFVSECCFTFQAADGKYLGLSGLPEDEKQLIAQSQPYLWTVDGSYGISRDFFTIWPGNGKERTRYVVNVGGFSTEDGAPIIVYTTRDDVGKDEMKNAAFCIKRVG